MAVDEQVILKLEKLAKLKTNLEERSKIGIDLEEMIPMVDKLLGSRQ